MPADESDARSHWKKSEQFAAAARLAFEHDLPTPAYSDAILSVLHAADAFCCHYLRLRHAGPNHLDAVALVKTIKELPDDERRPFAEHFERLLEIKSRVQYSGDEFDQKDAAQALKHMERALASVAPRAKSIRWPKS